MITILIKIITPTEYDTRYGFSFELLYENNHHEKPTSFNLHLNFSAKIFYLASILLFSALFLVPVKLGL